jgi:hypothetical protein
MSPTIAGIQASATRQSGQPPVGDTDPKLNIAVVFTSVQATLLALKEAGILASSLGARITLMACQVVPYPLALGNPPVQSDFNEKRFRIIASEGSVETIVRICLCRDPFEALTRALSPFSLIVLGGRKRWWPTREKTLVRRLRRAGHEVLFIESAYK